KHREDIVAHEFLAQILDEDVLRLDAEEQRFLPRRLELLALAEVGRERHDFAVIGRAQPLEDDGGVEPARIGEHHFPDRGCGHALLTAEMAAPGFVVAGRPSGVAVTMRLTRYRSRPGARPAPAAASAARKGFGPISRRGRTTRAAAACCGGWRGRRRRRHCR